MTFIYLLIFLNMIFVLKKGVSLLNKIISTTDSHVNEIFEQGSKGQQGYKHKLILYFPGI